MTRKKGRKRKHDILKWMRQVTSQVLKDNGLTYDSKPIYRDSISQLEQIANLPTPNKGEPFSSPKWRMVKALRALSSKYDYIDLELVNELRNLTRKQNSTNKKTQNRDAQVLGPLDKQIRAFYASYEWRRLRYTVLKEHGRTCMLCGTTTGPFNVDHIKPIRHYWHLRLKFDNLQVLCAECNHGKGSWDTTDWRSGTQKIEKLYSKRAGQ